MAYVIGSQKGKEKAESMKTGEKYTASDGSTWTKQSDGSISVTTSKGETFNNAYSPTSSSGSSNKNSQYTNTDYSTIGQQQMASGASWQDVQNTLNSRVNKALNTEGLEKYAYDDKYWAMYNYIQGQKNAETFSNYEDKIAELNQGRPGEYESKYDPKIDALLNQILNRDDFSYNVANDPLYQQYAQMYQREGERAMKDTLAEAAAGAGGMNTYAVTAAQQANNYYNSQLNDRIPELYQLAYNMYLQDIEGQVRDLGLLQNMDATQYNRYRDTMNDWYNDRNFAYGAYQDAVQQGNWQTNFDYNAMVDNRNFNNGEYWKNKEWDYNDMWKNKEWDYNDYWANKEWDYNDEWKNKEWDYNTSVYDSETAYNKVMELIANGATTIDPELIKKAGITDVAVSQMIKDRQIQQANKNKSSSSGGDGDEGGVGDEGKKKDGSKKVEDLIDDEGYYKPSQDDMSDYTVVNAFAEDWVVVTGLGRLTWQELASMVEKGTVIEKIDKENKRISYVQANTKKDDKKDDTYHSTGLTLEDYNPEEEFDLYKKAFGGR